MSRENNEMAYIAEVTHIFSIPDSDNIAKAVINSGWPVVVKRGEFAVASIWKLMRGYRLNLHRSCLRARSLRSTMA
jgi:hypothetical protein